MTEFQNILLGLLASTHPETVYLRTKAEQAPTAKHTALQLSGAIAEKVKGLPASAEPAARYPWSRTGNPCR